MHSLNLKFIREKNSNPFGGNFKHLKEFLYLSASVTLVFVQCIGFPFILLNTHNSGLMGL